MNNLKTSSSYSDSISLHRFSTSNVKLPAIETEFIKEFFGVEIQHVPDYLNCTIYSLLSKGTGGSFPGGKADGA
jgi:hypothetical protein